MYCRYNYKLISTFIDIYRCWAEKPADRPSFREIVKKLEYLYQVSNS